MTNEQLYGLRRSRERITYELLRYLASKGDRGARSTLVMYAANVDYPKALSILCGLQKLGYCTSLNESYGEKVSQRWFISQKGYNFVGMYGAFADELDKIYEETR